MTASLTVACTTRRSRRSAASSGSTPSAIAIIASRSMPREIASSPRRAAVWSEPETHSRANVSSSPATAMRWPVKIRYSRRYDSGDSLASSSSERSRNARRLHGATIELHYRAPREADRAALDAPRHRRRGMTLGDHRDTLVGVIGDADLRAVAQFEGHVEFIAATCRRDGKTGGDVGSRTR